MKNNNFFVNMTDSFYKILDSLSIRKENIGSLSKLQELQFARLQFSGIACKLTNIVHVIVIRCFVFR